MKRIQLVLTIILASTVIFVSCSDYVEKQDVEVEALTRLQSVFIPALNFPDGTTYQNYGNQVKFQLPTGYELTGIDSEGNRLNSDGGGITCDCQKGGSGCNPVKIRGRYGCEVAGSCTECKATKTTASNVLLVDAIIIKEDDFLNTEVSLQKLQTLPFAPQWLLNDTKFTEHIPNLQTGEYENVASLAVTEYRGLLIMQYLNESEINSATIVVGDETCSCDEGGSSCPRTKLGPAVSCDASNCKKCSMSGILTVDEESVKFSLKNGYLILD